MEGGEIMDELPILTKAGEKILHTCVNEMYDMYYNGSEITLFMIRSYIPESEIGNNELYECLKYLEELGIIQKLEFIPEPSFELTHFGFNFFKIEKAVLSRHRCKVAVESFLLPLTIAIVAAELTILASL